MRWLTPTKKGRLKKIHQKGVFGTTMEKSNDFITMLVLCTFFGYLGSLAVFFFGNLLLLVIEGLLWLKNGFWYSIMLTDLIDQKYFFWIESVSWDGIRKILQNSFLGSIHDFINIQFGFCTIIMLLFIGINELTEIYERMRT
jgi:hypothetical protein